MRQLAVAAALLLSLPALALAQNATTMSPANPGAGSQMPQPENSLPSGAATGMHGDTGSSAGTTHHHVTRHHRHAVHHSNPSHAMSHTVPQSSAQ